MRVNTQLWLKKNQIKIKKNPITKKESDQDKKNPITKHAIIDKTNIMVKSRYKKNPILPKIIRLVKRIQLGQK